MVQDYPKFEIVYFDNASNDSSLKIARQYPIRIIRSYKNLGYTGGCNKALSCCNSDYVLFLNQDTIASPDLITRLHTNLNNSRSTSITYPHIDDYKRYPQVSRLKCPLHFLSSAAALMFGEPANESKSVGFATGAAFMIRKDVLNHLGYLFDERLFMYYEDVDLSIRNIARGYSIEWVPATCIWHRSENPSLFAAYLSMRNIHLVIYKNFGSSYYLRTLPWILYQHIFIIFHFKKHHRIPTPIMISILTRAYIEAFSMIKAFRPEFDTRKTIASYHKIVTKKQVRDILNKFHQQIILYG